MNYIKQLEKENAELKNSIQTTENNLNHLIAFLHSDKFVGVEQDGSRKDWVSTGDAIQYVKNIRSALNNHLT